MINAVIQGVTDALYEGFAGIPIYIDHIPQGFAKSSFFIETMEPSQTQELDDRFRLTVPVRVHYFGAADGWDGLRIEAQRMAMELYGALLCIRADGYRRGSRMTHRLSDDCVLLFDVTYTLRFMRRPDVPDMRVLVRELNVK